MNRVGTGLDWTCPSGKMREAQVGPEDCSEWEKWKERAGGRVRRRRQEPGDRADARNMSTPSSLRWGQCWQMQVWADGELTSQVSAFWYNSQGQLLQGRGMGWAWGRVLPAPWEVTAECLGQAAQGSQKPGAIRTRGRWAACPPMLPPSWLFKPHYISSPSPFLAYQVVSKTVTRLMGKPINKSPSIQGTACSPPPPHAPSKYHRHVAASGPLTARRLGAAYQLKMWLLKKHTFADERGETGCPGLDVQESCHPHAIAVRAIVIKSIWRGRRGPHRKFARLDRSHLGKTWPLSCHLLSWVFPAEAADKSWEMTWAGV